MRKLLYVVGFLSLMMSGCIVRERPYHYGRWHHHHDDPWRY